MPDELDDDEIEIESCELCELPIDEAGHLPDCEYYVPDESPDCTEP